MEFNPLCILLTAVGGYMLFRLRLFYIIHPIRTAKRSFGAFKSISSVKSFMLALAGTLGVGNIFGVCFGLIVGGEGSVFWMLVSVFFSSVLKYSEVVISHDSRQSSACASCGGMVDTLLLSFKRIGRPMAITYALACMLLSLSMGSALQSGAVSETAVAFFDTPPVIIGVLLTLIIWISIVHGVRIIERITLFAVPLATIVYIFACCAIIISNLDNIPSVVSGILEDAFSPLSAGAGILGALLSEKIREGYSRGILSNEAGCGTSSIAHARSDVSDSALAGILGVLEVFFDTAVLCMLTAFAVLSAVPDVSVFNSGMALIVFAAEASLGRELAFVIPIAVLIFAYSTVVCWYYYGSLCFGFLFGTKRKFLFVPLFLSSVFMGTLVKSDFLFACTDLFILILAFLTSAAIIKNSDRIVVLSENSGLLPRMSHTRVSKKSYS